NLNLRSTFLLCQLAGRDMLARGYGKIINIASMLSFMGGLNVVSYTAAKTGIAGLTRALANEWAGRGINVNAIAPGWIKTKLTAALQQNEARYQSILARIPAGRWGVPEDLVGAAVFLASPASDYVNGHILAVDGGYLARG
ncbi:MAG: SDR family oxidoreductase, partial [Moorella sp. (in: Bacteria)]|nr:SDR family oxidoreductase [Moorella sp. (in: firmicutes)]